jgi:hypothetical protein
MPYADVLDEMVRQTRRKLDAYQALGKTSDEPNIAFTGTTITVDELTTHSRSEASLHRWDLVGDDALGDELLAEPALTAHAVNILNRMPVLAESAHSMAARAAASAPRPPRVVVRTPDSPDVRIDTAGVGYAELGGAETLDGDVIVTTDPANRLLVLWGRRSAHRSIEIEGPADLAAALPAIVWPNAQPWPPA